LRRFLKRESETKKKGLQDFQMLKGQKASARCFLTMSYGRHRARVESSKLEGQDVEVASKNKRGCFIYLTVNKTLLERKTLRSGDSQRTKGEEVSHKLPRF
jgi:hypothetical protein